MKQNLLFMLAGVSAASAYGGEATYPSASSLYDMVIPADRSLVFDIYSQGKSLPILWGFDTAWNDYGNMLRGVRYTTGANVGVARVSFQPWAKIEEKGVLPSSLQTNLNQRLANVALLGKNVDIALNLDGGEPTIKEIYGGLDSKNNYVGDPDAVAEEYAKLIDATAAAVEKAGYRVISAAPFNEPDYFWNGTPINVFDKINRRLKDFDSYPRFRDIRISGGNTLNCDEALPWYEELKDYLDEGNTHQLAGDFDHYADFFAAVRADGKYATADELHNVMEAMVGVEYGMQTGIWWGTAEQARGEFCKASGGMRLAYAENRKAWSAASVYRAPSGKIQAFLGCSERQALPSTYNIVSRSGNMFVNGVGPLREYVASLPGDPNGGYMTELQRNAETVLNITRGEDIQQAVGGDYVLVNAASHLVLSGKGGTTENGTDIIQSAYKRRDDQIWRVSAVPETQGGDFSYYFIRNAASGQSLDDNNWNLSESGKVIAYDFSGAAVQQWALEYDGDGWFHIRNKQSALYLECGEGEGRMALQNSRKDVATQMWRLLPVGASIEFDAPATPSGLKASPRTASVMLEWDAVPEDGVSYTVLRAEKGSDDYNTIARGLKTTGFLDNSVAGDQEYSYKVVATDKALNRSEASSSVSCGAEGKAMIAHFPLNGSLDDEGGNGFVAHTVASAVFRNGYNDDVKSLYMRGQQYLQLPYSALQSDSFSVAFWLFVNSSTEDMQVLSTGVSENERMYFTPLSGGAMKVVAQNENNYSEIIAPSIPSQTWFHVAITAEGEKVTLFVNGENVGEEDFSGAFPADRLLTYMGRPHESTSTYFIGSLGDVKIFNYALDESGVKAAMAGVDSGVGEIIGDETTIVNIEYFTPQGVKVSQPLENGITIVRTTYSDGKVKVHKQR